nr:copper resistance protein B [Novosphingobium hassiacum]
MSSPALADPIEAEIDLFELHVGDGDEHFTFDSAISTGSDTDRFELRASGGSDVGPTIDNVQLEALYVHNFSDSFTALVGARQDVRPGSDLAHVSAAFVVLPVEWLEIEHFFYLSENGNLIGSGQLLASIDASDGVTVEPRLNINWAAQTIVDESVGSGVTDIQAAVRVRKSLGPHLEAYAGAIHERLLGKTRMIATADGGRSSVNRVIIGAATAWASASCWPDRRCAAVASCGSAAVASCSIRTTRAGQAATVSE